MKRLFILIFLLPCVVFAQEKQLIIQGTAPGLYVNHTISAKENYYSIGRLYNISPKEIAAFNTMQMDKGLSLGQAIKIPLVQANFTQTTAVAADEALVPVYYIVQAKEGLYRVSIAGNKVPIESIKQWNNLTGNEVSVNSHLIIGYLKVKKELSALADMATKPMVNAPIKQPVQETQQPEAVVENKSIPKPIAANETQEEELKEMVKPGDAVPPKVLPATEPVQASITPVVMKSKDFNGGVFKTLYQVQNEVQQNGEAGVFKSTSGWEDGRYYCLHNTAQPQTIIKITNNATGKSIYAKVMDVMPDIKQNKGVDILISNAAADQLGVAGNKFDCTINYSK